MTIWERLFGTPERTEETLKEMALSSLDYCYMLDALSDDEDAKCRNCPYEFDRYGCEHSEINDLQWLTKDVTDG